MFLSPFKSVSGSVHFRYREIKFPRRLYSVLFSVKTLQQMKNGKDFPLTARIEWIFFVLRFLANHELSVYFMFIRKLCAVYVLRFVIQQSRPPRVFCHENV